MRKAFAGIAAAAMAVIGLFAVPATAQAATNPYSPWSACGYGGSNNIVDMATLKASNGTIVSRVYLLYSNGQNCVVNLKVANVGTATWLDAAIHVEGQYDQYDNPLIRTDAGKYKYFAVVKASGTSGKCVKWGGESDYLLPSGAWSSPAYWSGFEHCG